MVVPLHTGGVVSGVAGFEKPQSAVRPPRSATVSCSDASAYWLTMLAVITTCVAPLALYGSAGFVVTLTAVPLIVFRPSASVTVNTLPLTEHAGGVFCGGL